LGRKKLLNKTKITNKQLEPIEKEILKRDLALINITELKELPNYWMRGYSLQPDETIEDCCKLYKSHYNHEPLEGWLYTNKQTHRKLYLRISDEERE
jgi:hypothetical protein